MHPAAVLNQMPSVPAGKERHERWLFSAFSVFSGVGSLPRLQERLQLGRRFAAEARDDRDLLDARQPQALD